MISVHGPKPTRLAAISFAKLFAFMPLGPPKTCVVKHKAAFNLPFVLLRSSTAVFITLDHFPPPPPKKSQTTKLNIPSNSPDGQLMYYELASYVTSTGTTLSFFGVHRANCG